MKQVLVYADSLSWGIIPDTRTRLSFDLRWPGNLEGLCRSQGQDLRIIEDCLNGRRTVLDDPFKPGRNGLEGLQQKIEINSPLSLVIIMLGNNDFQSSHGFTAKEAAQGVATLVHSIRQAPLEPGMQVPPILLVCPPPILEPRGVIAEKFRGADSKWAGFDQALARVANETNCYFFDAGSVISASTIDGIHLDRAQHGELAAALQPVVAEILA